MTTDLQGGFGDPQMAAQAGTEEAAEAVFTHIVEQHIWRNLQRVGQQCGLVEDEPVCEEGRAPTRGQKVREPASGNGPAQQSNVGAAASSTKVVVPRGKCLACTACSNKNQHATTTFRGAALPIHGTVNAMRYDGWREGSGIDVGGDGLDGRSGGCEALALCEPWLLS